MTLWSRVRGSLFPNATVFLKPKVTGNSDGGSGDTTNRFEVDVWQKSTDSAQYGDAMRINTCDGRAKGGINYTSKGYPAVLVSTIASTFNVTDGQTLTLKIDGGAVKTVTFSTGGGTPITSGAATADQVCNAINAGIDGDLQALKTPGGDSDFIRLVSRTIGASGSIEITGGTAQAALGLAIGTVTGEPVASPATFTPGTTDGANQYANYNITNGLTLLITVNSILTTVTFSTGGGTPITSGAATWQQVVAAINAVASGFVAYPIFDPERGVRVAVKTTTYGTGNTLVVGAGTANAALGYAATTRNGSNGTAGSGRQLGWGVLHWLANSNTTSTEHWHWSFETADDEGKARTRFEIKFLADICRIIFSSSYVILSDCNMFISSLAGNRDLWFTSNNQPQPKYRLAGVRSRATAATGAGRAAGAAGDLQLMTTDSTGGIQEIAIAHRLTNAALSMRRGLMLLQRTTSVAPASALTIGPENGNVFFVSASGTAINTINRTGWQAGSEITLHFIGVSTLNHATTASTATIAHIRLVGGVPYVSAAGTSIRLQLLYDTGVASDTTGLYWREVSRALA